MSDSRIDVPAANGEIDFVTLCGVCWRHKFIVIGTTLVATAIAVALALTATPMYRAEVSVTEASENGLGAAGALTRQLGGLASLAGIDIAGGDAAARNAQAVLKSRHLVEEFIKRYDLVPQLYAKARKPPTLWRAVKMFREDLLTIREDKRANVLTVAVAWEDPQAAARWANDFVALANETVRNRALADAKRNIGYLNEQIDATNVIEMRRVMYNLIENETKTLMLANARAEYAFTVVDPAVTPELRFSPRRTLMVLAGGALGGFLGLVAAFVMDARRRPKGAVA